MRDPITVIKRGAVFDWDDHLENVQNTVHYAEHSNGNPFTAQELEDVNLKLLERQKDARHLLWD